MVIFFFFFKTDFKILFSVQIDRQQFEETVRTLNNLYAEAEKLGGQSYLEGCLACLTAYTIFLCMETHYEKVSLPVFSESLTSIKKKKVGFVTGYVYMVTLAIKFKGPFIIIIIQILLLPL